MRRVMDEARRKGESRLHCEVEEIAVAVGADPEDVREMFREQDRKYKRHTGKRRMVLIPGEDTIHWNL